MYSTYSLSLISVVWSWPSISDILLKPVAASDPTNPLNDGKPLLKEFDSLNRISPEETRGALSENNGNILTNYLYQGNALWTKGHFAAVHPENSSNSISRRKRQAIYGGLWPDGIVYYYIDNSINQRKRNSINAAHEYIQSRTCITFKMNPRAPNRIKVSDAAPKTCQSYHGMTGQGEQPLYLGSECEVMGVVAHEFIHALGFVHTHMRYDRDQYIKVDTTHVDEKFRGYFAKTDPSQTINYVPYEYGSVMHYTPDLFTNDNATAIRPLDEEYLYTAGSQLISFYDIHMINTRYQCYDRCGSSIKCANGGVPNPRNCAVCNCPYGYGGATCNERPPGCGKILQASTSWQTAEITVGNPNQGEKDVFTLCNHWITAPKGGNIQVKLVGIKAHCIYGCSSNGIEIKTKRDQKITNPRYCCSKYINTILKSSVNPTPIISFSRNNSSIFTIQFKYT